MSDVGMNQVIAQMRVMASAARSEGAPGGAARGVAGRMDFSALMQDSIDAVNASMMEATDRSAQQAAYGLPGSHEYAGLMRAARGAKMPIGESITVSINRPDRVTAYG